MLSKKISLALAIFLASCCSENNSFQDSKKNQQSLQTTEVKTDQTTAQVVAKDSGKHLVFFETNSSVLSSDAVKILDEKVLSQVKNPEISVVRIEGYCDERGSVAYNKKLGEQRAKSVKSYLVKNGVKSSKIKVVSFGEANPVDGAHNADAWEKNRRVVTITTK